MKRRLAAGDVDLRDVCDFARFGDNASQEIDGKEFGVRAVEIVFGAKTVAAMQVADVGEFHAQALGTIVIAERGICLHFSFGLTRPLRDRVRVDPCRRKEKNPLPGVPTAKEA